MFQNTYTPQASQAPLVNTDAVWTGAAPTDGTCWALDNIIFSYSANPAVNAKLTITVGAVTETLYITRGGPDVLNFFGSRRFPPNTSVVVTLQAGGAGVFGTVYPNGRTQN